jgi:hypothetical protein
MKPKSLFKRVFDFAKAELERRAQKPEAPAERTPRRATLPPPRASELSAGGAAPSDVVGLQLTHSQGGLRLAWSISQPEIARARSLIDSDAVLCVRVVAFSPLRDDVLREVQDRPNVDPQGSCDVGLVDGRAIVSVGLRAGERFVSITHHVV